MKWKTWKKKSKWLFCDFLATLFSLCQKQTIHQTLHVCLLYNHNNNNENSNELWRMNAAATMASKSVFCTSFTACFTFMHSNKQFSIALLCGNDFVASQSNVLLQTATEFNDKEAHKSFSCNIDIYVFPWIQRKRSDCG